MERVYLDWNATSPPCPEALAAFAAAAQHHWGNASSLHREGREAAALADRARLQLAEWTRTRPIEWILTSGGTESIHAGILGCLKARSSARRIVSSQGEHASTEGVLADLEGQGWEVVRVGLRRDGTWDPQEVLRACSEHPTAMVTLIWANNETGAISDVFPVAKALREAKIPLHLDAVQCFGKMEVDLSRVPADFVSMSGHKFQATKGIGALRVRTGAPWSRWIQGGNQERSRRGGTVDVPSAAALAAAIERTRAAGPIEAGLRDGLEVALLKEISGLEVVASGASRLANTLCLVVDGADSSALLARMDERGFAIASGSACSTGSPEPSRILLAMGIPSHRAHCAVRISLGPGTTVEQLGRFQAAFKEEVSRVRSIAMGSTK